MRLVCCLVAVISLSATAEAVLLQIDRGPVNGVLFEQNGRRLAVYGWKPENSAGIDYVLLAHGRRDLVWRALPMHAAGARLIAPLRERHSLERGPEFWKDFSTSQFHDYGQQSLKVLAKSVPVERWISDGESVEWEGLMFRALETPGYTRGSMTWIVQLDTQKIALTGDLIYGDGQIADLFSFQDAINDAQIRGYHGYGARLAELVSSLQRVAAEKPDQLIPARGPVIEHPQEAIARLIQRVQAVYRNYLSTSALHWYFKEDRMRRCGERVLGPGAAIELMPYSQHEKTPEWIYENSTSRLLISDTGNAFLLDCGYQRVIDAVQELITQGVVSRVEGIFVTHYHDDHTDMVQAAADAFHCPVYALHEYADLLANPRAWHLPAMTANGIRDIRAVSSGHQMKWHEFRLTFHFFPGQTWYHGALFVEKEQQKPVFFIGDSFAPSGLDDYCVQNRNLLHEESGYLLCLKTLRAVGKPFWLVNEHIPHVFSFSGDELDYLEKRYRERIAVLKELFPWDDPNYGVDEQWAVLYPRSATLAAGGTLTLQFRITNHSPTERTFTVTPHVPDGWTLARSVESLVLPARQSGAVEFSVTASTAPGTFLLTADVSSAGMDFREWADAVITVP